MIEIPTWLLFVLVFSIVILFVFNQDLTIKMNRIKFDQIQIGIIVNKSFMDITQDMNNLNKGMDNIDLKYDEIKNKLSKINS
jgi:ABC-type sulfate transport system permease component